MKINEIILLETKFNFPISDIDKIAPNDPKEYDALYNKRTPHIGPHEGKYLELMLHGIKPAARISGGYQYSQFKPYIKSGRIKVVGKLGTDYVLTLPGEEWRGEKLLELWPKLYAAVDAHDIEKEVQMHTKIGLLLGYPKESVKRFEKQTRDNFKLRAT